MVLLVVPVPLVIPKAGIQALAGFCLSAK